MLGAQPNLRFVDPSSRRRIAGARGGQVATCERIRLAIDDIDGLRQGAFAPFHEQPAVRALLIPFGGIGAAVLLDLMATGL